MCIYFDWCNSRRHLPILPPVSTNFNSPFLEDASAKRLGHARHQAQYLYRFLATNGYRHPAITRIPNGAAGKFAMVFDLSRGQLCYFAHNNTFHLGSFTDQISSGPSKVYFFRIRAGLGGKAGTTIEANQASGSR
jgi:hypothetical protein